MTMETNTFWNRVRTKLMTPVAVVSIILVLAFGAWVSVAAVRATPAVGEFFIGEFWRNVSAALVSLSSIFVPADKITVVLQPATVESGVAVTLTWEHREPAPGGAYAFHYPCDTGVLLETPEHLAVKCGMDLSVSGRSTLTIIPLLTGEVETLPISIRYIENTALIVSGTAELTVTPSDKTADDRMEKVGSNTPVPAKPMPVVPPPVKKETFTAYDGVTTATTGAKTEKTYTVTSPVPATANGLPDLMVNILAVGVIDPTTNVFTATSSVKLSERAAVRFEIANRGGKPSGAWRFNAVLPTFPAHIFHSEDQQTLAPGDKIEFTLGFDQIDPNQTTGTIVINADPTSSIKESNEDNNMVKAVINIVK